MQAACKRQRNNKGDQMEKQQNFDEPKGRVSAASKMGTGRKRSGNDATASPAQGPSRSEGTSDPRMSSNQEASGEKTNQETINRSAGEQDLLQHAKDATGNIVNQVQQRAGSTFARQKESAATDLSQVVQAVRQFGESLGREESGPIARYAADYSDKAANNLERLGSYIREKDPKQLLNDMQNFGRRRPVLLLGGAFLLGFTGARLIKSSTNLEHRPTGPNAL